ncbi:hypothetical protein Cfor_10920, partial [Coptotermes formosanus]
MACAITGSNCDVFSSVGRREVTLFSTCRTIEGLVARIPEAVATVAGDVWQYNGTPFVETLGTVHLFQLDSGSVETLAVFNIVHSEHDADSRSNDIALLELLTPVEFTLCISPVRLPSRSQFTTNSVGGTVRCSGWDRFSD